MPDKYTKVSTPEKPGQPEPSGDDWKVVDVEKVHQPELENTIITYRQLEQEILDISSRIAFLTETKAEMEAEMAKVKTAAEA